MHRFHTYGVLLLCAAWLLGPVAGARAQTEDDLFERAPWSLSLGIGRMDFEGDEEVKDGNLLALKLGYDLNTHWAVEGVFILLPHLDNNTFQDPNRFALDESIWGARLGVDLLYHLRNTKNLHFDPYLAAGTGLVLWEKSLGAGREELAGTAGAGLFYHFTDEWALRGDVRTDVVGADTEFKLYYNIGVAWRWGADPGPAYTVSGGEIDSDGDGLLDSEEAAIGTDPYDPDTDKDGLSDGQEYHGVPAGEAARRLSGDPGLSVYRTNPLDPDTDLDALKDGAEVYTYETNPLDRDTDKGGVADGHEVIEDNTNPLDPSDDLQLYTLKIEFDYDKAVLRPEDYDELDVVVKVLQRDPGATARIEGHADKRPTSVRQYNIKLSKRRAEAVKDYLVDVGGIDASRLTTEGYGFDRPIAPNDTEANMQLNRRTEVYIRPSSGGAEERYEGHVEPVEMTPAVEETIK